MSAIARRAYRSWYPRPRLERRRHSERSDGVQHAAHFFFVTRVRSTSVRERSSSLPTAWYTALAFASQHELTGIAIVAKLPAVLLPHPPSIGHRPPRPIVLRPMSGSPGSPLAVLDSVGSGTLTHMVSMPKLLS